MKCPVCPDTNLLMTERQGVEIDYCPQCRGIWLDRGELDKLLERSAAQVSPPQMTRSEPYKRDEHSSHHGAYGQDPRRKKSWLSEIFD